MSRPLAICIEDLDAQSGIAKYTRCVALPGRQPGLRLDETGRVLWQSDDRVSCELWVSADEHLILYRLEGATHVTLHRAGRSLDVPFGKPVVVIDQDQIDVGPRRLRVHVHGEAPSVVAPSPLPSRLRPFDRVTQAAAAAAVIGAVAATGSCTVSTEGIVIEPFPAATPTIEVRENVPEKVVYTPTVGVNSIAEAIHGPWTAAQAYDVEGKRVWVIGVLTIEGNRYGFAPLLEEVKGPSVQGRLDFLFDAPDGEVTIKYRDEVTPDAPFVGFAPGDVLADCTFRANSVVVGEFQIRVGDSNSLYLTGQSGEVGLWSITK